MKVKSLLIMTVFVPLLAFADNLNIASPYSRYGYGDILPTSVGAEKSMGGLGYGIRDHRVINPMNPASYSSIDSLTFMMNVGVSGTVNGLTDGQTKPYNQFRGRVDYVAFQFPLYKSLGLSFGLLPFSSVGYQYSSTYQLKDEEFSDASTVKQTFMGTGGFTQVYLGLSYDIMNRVAIGVNGKFMFGKIEHDRRVSFPDNPLYTSTAQSHIMNASTFLCDVGLQYHQPIKKDVLTVGATYSFKLPMNISSQIVTMTNKEAVNTTGYDFDFPNTVGVGVSYKMKEMLLLGVDFEWRDWSNARYFSCTDTLKTTYRVAFGVEYCYKYGSKRYTDNFRYRIGAKYGRSYAQINGNRYNEFGVTVGLGLPLRSSLTTINVYFEYSHRGDVKTVGIVEDCFNFGIDVSLNERWFVKRKLN